MPASVLPARRTPLSVSEGPAREPVYALGVTGAGTQPRERAATWLIWDLSRERRTDRTCCRSGWWCRIRAVRTAAPVTRAFHGLADSR